MESEIFSWSVSGAVDDEDEGGVSSDNVFRYANSCGHKNQESNHNMIQRSLTKPIRSRTGSVQIIFHSEHVTNTKAS